MGFGLTVTDILLTLALVLLFKWIISLLQKPPLFPPGPPSVPVLGSLPFLPGRGVEKFVSEYVSSFGPVTGSASKSSIRWFVITEKAPTRAFSWLKAATTAFTFKTLIRHYAKQALTPWSLNVKLGPRRKGHKGRAVWLA